MAILHLVRTSAFNDQQLALCIEALNKNDGLILLDDGIYNLKHPSLVSAQQLCNKLFFIDEHAKARGFDMNIESNTKNITPISPISMAKLVELIFDFKASITWQ